MQYTFIFILKNGVIKEMSPLFVEVVGERHWRDLRQDVGNDINTSKIKQE